MSLAQYKMFKTTADHDRERGATNAHKAGLAGAAAALLAGRGKVPTPLPARELPLARDLIRDAGQASVNAGRRLRASGIGRTAAGYVAGAATVHAVRAVTSGTKDVYGDRSYRAKAAERLPMWAGIGAAGVLAHRRLTGRRMFAAAVPVILLDTGSRVGAGVITGGVIGVARRIGRGVLRQAPEVGAIAAGDLIAGGIHDDLQKKKQQQQQQQRQMSAVLRTVIELSREQLRNENWVHVDPLAAASGEVQARKPRVDGNGNYVRDRAGKIITDPHNVTVAHAQVLRAAYNKGLKIQRYGRRGMSLTQDAVGALKGEKKVDERGRPLKREWEKSWFRNAVGAAVVGGGLLAHAHVMRTNPDYRKRVVGAKNAVKSRINKIIPDSFPHFDFSPVGLIMLDAYAEMKGWDVRDPRGRSARVFAPGARQRERREKKWHERVDNIRKLAIVGTAAGLALGGTAGFLIGRRHPVSVLKPRPRVRTPNAGDTANIIEGEFKKVG